MDDKSNAPMPDFDNMTYTCNCCKMKRQDKYIKIARHDVSDLLGEETGTLLYNVRFCNDMPMCEEKARNREWVIMNVCAPSIREPYIQSKAK